MSEESVNTHARDRVVEIRTVLLSRLRGLFLLDISRLHLLARGLQLLDLLRRRHDLSLRLGSAHDV